MGGETMDLKSYSSLAWTMPIIASPEEYEEEVRYFVDAIEKHARGECKRMLHLGCGAGGHDYQFKKYFEITGVDISPEMLNLAREINPEVRYILGDMREVRLEQKFDMVIIPDSVSYMSNRKDLKKALDTAAYHLRPGGIFLVVTHTKEEFQNNNFLYSGTRGDIHVTLFENNYITSKNQFEATLVYLIRKRGKLQVEYDVHTLGLFGHETWLKLLYGANFYVNEVFNMDEIYDRYLFEGGEYRMKAYICTLLE